ncbi:MAG TPA: YceI family protein [Anaeromyxobacteraceae bacterium]|nr:YceI family protein [Anaeromyxobacteraceae bacterium]
MKKLLAVVVTLAPALAFSAPSSWEIDPAHSQAAFTVKHLVITSVRGEFAKTAGTVVLDDENPARSKVEATIDASTVSTRNPDRDAHLRSPDFFDVAKYPTITFKSTHVDVVSPGELKVAGDLTLHGITKPVVLEVSESAEVKGMSGETRRAFSASAKINRQDYGLKWSKMVDAGPVVGDEVAISLEIEAVKAK